MIWVFLVELRSNLNRLILLSWVIILQTKSTIRK